SHLGPKPGDPASSGCRDRSLRGEGPPGQPVLRDPETVNSPVGEVAADEAPERLFGARAFLSSSLVCPALPGAQRPGCWRTGEGCVVELLVNVDEDGVVFDLACVNRDGAAGKHADGLAGGQVVA